MSQFSELMDKLEEIETVVFRILEAVTQDDGVLRLDDDSEGEVIRPVEDPSVPRNRVPYKDVNGEEKIMDFNDLDEKVQALYTLANNMKEPVQIYVLGDGEPRVMVSNRVLDTYNRRRLGDNLGG